MARLPSSLVASVLLALASAVFGGCGDDDTLPDAGDPEPDAGSDASDDDPLLVATTAGPVRGAEFRGVRAFLGIPYAAPPVGERRWQPPSAPEPWTEPLDAAVLGPPCPQKEMLGDGLVEDAREDCLTANVWAPADAAGSLPVMVWLHGGGFVSGSGGEALYDGVGLVSAHDVVLVTVNYRLGALGFLALPELGEGQGAFGLLDQRAALEWVQANIASFGGDPQNVTVFGESAGSMSVCMHLVSPGSAGLFSAAVMQSGSCAIPLASLETAHATGRDLIAAVGCEDDADPIACLRAVQPNTLVTALVAPEQASFVESFVWFPPVDGAVVPDLPATLLEQGAFADVPVLLGTNTDEGAVLVRFGYPDLDEAGYEALVRANVGDAAGDVLARYSIEQYGDVEHALTRLLTEGMFVCPTRFAARALAAAGRDVLLYSFAEGFEIPILPGLGAFHGSEIPYVFGNGLYGMELDEAQRTLSTEMQGYWTRFASVGDPNDAAATTWPLWTEATREHLVLDLPLPIATGSDLSADACDFWDGVELPR